MYTADDVVALIASGEYAQHRDAIAAQMAAKRGVHPKIAHSLSLTEAATYVSRTVRTIRRWVADGKLHGVVRIGQQVRIPQASLDAMVVQVTPSAR